MHSVVIHIKKKPQEWHLVESIFYKVQASGQLLILEFNLHGNWEHMYKQVQSYIVQNRIEHWQLLLLNNNELNEKNRNSLTREIYIIKEKLLKRLSSDDIAPSRRILLTLDGLKRKGDYSPILEKNLFQWQMDNFGYIKYEAKEERFYGNAFLEKEIELIDKEWGEKVDLKEAGPMEVPKEKFLNELDDRKEKVETILKNIINEKKNLLNKQNQIVNDDLFYELHSSEELDEIFNEFCTHIKEMCTPPFSYHLSTFRPSILLKTLLKENLGVSSVIDDFLLIRKDISEYAPFQKIKGLMEFAFLLYAICIQPEVIDRVGNGLPFEVEVGLNENELKDMYTNYYSCLQVAKEKIENRNLAQDHFMTNKYAEITALPYSADPLKENGIDSPDFKYKNRRTYLQDWYSFLDDIELDLKNREELSIEATKKGVKVLAVTKRQKQDHFLEETIDINEYAQILKKKKNQLQTELDEATPSLSVAREKWKKSSAQLKKRMDLLVKTIPTKNIWITTSLIVFICILIPYLSNPNQLNRQNSIYPYLKYFIIPALLYCVILIICSITFKMLQKPISRLVEETISIKKALADEQLEEHSKYNDYLNSIYKLYRVRNQFHELEEKSGQQKEVNVLYRWHQVEINHHITLLNQLLESLRIETHTENKQKCISYFNTVFDVKQNIYKNPIYSPIDCQFDNGKNGHSLDVYVENSRDEITTWSLNPIEKLRFTQDKVFSL